jgi:hypothetical protein
MTGSSRTLNLMKMIMNMINYEVMREENRWRESRSTNEWCGRGDVRSRSNRNVGTPGEQERKNTRRAARGDKHRRVWRISEMM